MSDVIVYDDGPSELAARLREALAAEGAPYVTGVDVRTKVPTGSDPYATSGPLVVVTQNAPGAARLDALNVVPVRVMVWHSTDDDAFDLATLVHGHLRAHSGDVVRSVLRGTTPWVTADPDSGEPLAQFTVTANVRGRLHTA